MAEITFRPATVADQPRAQRPYGSKYDPLLEAIRSGPQICEGIVDGNVFRQALFGVGKRRGFRVSVRAIDKAKGIYRVELRDGS